MMKYELMNWECAPAPFNIQRSINVHTARAGHRLITGQCFHQQPADLAPGSPRPQAPGLTGSRAREVFKTGRLHPSSSHQLL